MCICFIQYSSRYCFVLVETDFTILNSFVTWVTLVTLVSEREFMLKRIYVSAFGPVALVCGPCALHSQQGSLSAQIVFLLFPIFCGNAIIRILSIDCLRDICVSDN